MIGRFVSDLVRTPKTCFPMTQPKHYENTPMQYTAIFRGSKNDNFQLNSFDYFHIFAQNIYCGYTSTHNICFRVKLRK